MLWVGAARPKPNQRMDLNTKQLIVVWYASLAVAFVLTAHGLENPSSRPVSLIFAIAAVAAASIISFAPNRSARKRIVALGVLIPVLLVAGAVAYVVWRSEYSDAAEVARQQKEFGVDPFRGLPAIIDPKDLELFDMSLKPSPIPHEAWLTGRVRNKSSHAIQQFDLWIQIYDGGAKSDSAGTRVQFMLPVPVSEAKSFETKVDGLRFPAEWTWKYEIYNSLGPSR